MTAPVLEDGVADPAPGAVDPHDPPVEGVPNRLYGRRRGHPLRARQERLLQLAAPRLSADPAGIADPGALFASRPDEVWVEVGFGGGEHAEALARANPRAGLIASGVFENGICALLSRLVPEGGEETAPGLPNLRLWTRDARHLLAGLPEADQVDFLRATLEDFDEAVTLLDGMVTAWSGGDVDELDRIVVKEMKTDAPAAYDALLVRRNANWAGQIETLLKGSGTAFIVVGAAHLAGADSVQSMLEARGVDVRPAG